MTDTFSTLSSVGITAPAINAGSVTPSDTADLGYVTRGIMLGVGGNVNADPVGAEGDTTVLFSNLLAGVVYPLRLKRIRSTSTTATSIVALW